MLSDILLQSSIVKSKKKSAYDGVEYQVFVVMHLEKVGFEWRKNSSKPNTNTHYRQKRG